MTVPLESGRYVVSDLIGEGAMGLVYRAFDRELGHDVALKTLRASLPDDVYHLKKEFRALVDLEHVNLVQLYDLVVGSGQCFFTMELVSGPRIDEWIRLAESPSAASHRAALALWQLASGLGALHAAGKLHRDIKPSNILVTAQDRLVLLDMGLVSHFTSNRSRRSQVGQLAGTLEYMAPEQGRGELLTPAADWYSVGTVLYEALVGTLPWGEPGRQHFGVQSLPVVPVAQRVPGTSHDLSDLIADLLSKDPELRPNHEGVAERLQAFGFDRGVRWSVPSPAVRPRIVGREQELHRLRAAFDLAAASSSNVVCLTGASGIGKTALLDHFLESLEEADLATVFRSRCHHRELIPFKAIDGLVDQLTRHLTKLPTRELEKLIPKTLPELSRVFPVLDRIRVFAPTLASSTSSLPRRDTSAVLLEGDQRAQRSAFSCLREILGRIAAVRPVVLWIDDLQWGDLDSVRLLKALLRTSSPILFVFSYRSEDAESSAPLRSLLSHLAEEGPVKCQTIEVPPLTLDEVELLAHELLNPESRRPETIRQAAENARGSPYLLRELARELSSGNPQESPQQPADVAALIRGRVARLPADAREILELVCVAGRPLAEHIARRTSLGNEKSALSLLRNQSLLRIAPVAGSHGLDVYHDRIREAINDSLPTERRKALHRKLADLLDGVEDTDPHRLVHHFLLADEPERAARAAAAAADRAIQVLAFDLAAGLLQRALELGGLSEPEWVVQERVGRALSNAGRGGEAASAFNRAADVLAKTDPESADVARLRLLGAEHLLRAGILGQGLEAMYQVLALEKIPYHDGTWSAIAWAIANRPRVLWHKQRYYKAKGEVEVTPRARHELNMLWSAGVGLSAFFPMRAMEFQVRHALLAYKHRDAPHVARALSTEAVFLAMEGSEKTIREADALQLEATRIAQHSTDGSMRTHVAMNSAAITFFSARPRQAAEEADQAIQLCREYGGMGWELVNARLFSLGALARLGEISELRERQADALEEARERDDTYALTCYSVGLPSVVWLVDDEVDRLRAQVQRALEQAPKTTALSFLGVLSLAQADLYTGNVRAAFDAVQEHWRTLKQTFNLRIAFIRVEAHYLRGRVSVALAGETEGKERERLLKSTHEDARLLRQERFAYASHYADCLDAAVYCARGDRATAVELLERAALGFTSQQLLMNATACRYQLAERLDAVEPHRARANLWFDTNGVVRPAPFCQTFVPLAVPRTGE